MRIHSCFSPSGNPKPAVISNTARNLPLQRSQDNAHKDTTRFLPTVEMTGNHRQLQARRHSERSEKSPATTLTRTLRDFSLRSK